MEIKKPKAFLSVMIVSSILIIINGILIVFNNQPLIFASYSANNLVDVWVTPYVKHPPWARVVYGMPGLVEDGAAYVWLSMAILYVALVLYVFIKPKKLKIMSPWLIILSLLTIPIGGGFYVGVILSMIMGLYGLEYPKKFEDTFIGTILKALRFNSKIFENAIANPNLQKAMLTLFFIGLLSGLGSCLYSYNVYKIYSTSDPLKSEIALQILIQGKIYSEPIVFISAISNVFIIVIKWLILTISIYFFAFKITGKEIPLTAISSALTYIYVPELIFTFTPLIFTNEPNLSLTWSLLIIPMSWPLILFYVSRLWSFGLLTYLTLKAQDITFGRAIGRTLFAVVPYSIITYLWVYPLFNAPGFYITFAGESASMITFFLTIVYVIAFLFGALKRE